MRRFGLAVLLIIGLPCAHAKSASIVTQYDGVPEPAQAAFEAATEIWSNCLISDAPIKINVKWIERGPTGFAIPNSARNLDHLPVQDVLYPTALSNALAGARLNGDEDDINIFLSARTDWYFDTPTPIALDQTDFINVAVHEIGHGLGISTTSFVPWDGSGNATLGLPNPFVDFFDYTFPAPVLDGTPSVFDARIKLPDGRSLIDLENNSVELTEALNSSGLIFEGASAQAANQNSPVEVTAGSITHIPAKTGFPTPIMEASSGQGESVRQPDAILLGMLTDLGWQISDRCGA